MHPILKSHCETGNFSHGYLLAGDIEKSRISGREAAAVLLNCKKDSLGSHPDFSENFFDIFELDQVNALKIKFSMKPILAERKVFLLNINSFERSAAISFSKAFEDSPQTCYLFFITAPATDIPSILRSRLINIVEGDFELNEEKKNFYEKFLKTGPVERLSLIKNSASDTRIALEFLNELEIVLNEIIKKQLLPSSTSSTRTDLVEDRQGRSLSFSILSSLEELQKDRQFLFDRAPSPRMILEHLALTLPQVK